ncbi:hypothetical protein BH23ACT11_BH23ACT11_19250 [soil metagenome]
MVDLKNSLGDEELKRSVIEQLDVLDRKGNLEVLGFSRKLATGTTEKGGAMLAFGGSFPEEDLNEMEKIIVEEFEKVDEEGW